MTGDEIELFNRLIEHAKRQRQYRDNEQADSALRVIDSLDSSGT